MKFIYALLLVFVSPLAHADESQASRSWFDEVGEEAIGDRGAPGIEALLRQISDPISRASNACRIEVLRKLGWNFVADASRTKFQAEIGNPCDNRTLAEAQAAGEMTVRAPSDLGASLDPVAVGNFLNGLLFNDASVCSYKFRVSPAAKAAGQTLASNPDFEFTAGSSFIIFYGRDIPWLGSCVSRMGAAQCYRAKSSPARAMLQFTEGRSASECAVGLQLAELETLHQLYGSAGFDARFDPREIAIGPWSVLQSTASATWGQMTNADTLKDKFAEVAAEKGARWFEGLSGYIGNVFGERYLDNPVDRGENFLTVEVSQEAAAQFAEHGSFVTLNAWSRKVWELAYGLNGKGIDLIGNNESLDHYRMSPSVRERISTARTYIRQPVFSGYKVYVHPLKVMSLGEHIVRLLKRNPRTPYAMQLYPSRVHKGLYRRYVNMLAETCAN